MGLKRKGKKDSFRFRIKLIIFAVVLIYGCRYSFTGASVPPHLKTIAIPVFDDQSGYGRATLREELTNKIVERFILDNTLKIADKSTASSLLEGVIVSVQDNPVVVGTGERVVKSRITITVRVGFYDMVKRTKVWERTFSNWGEYELEGNIQNNLQLGIKQAIEKLSEDILLATVANW
ncbi:Lipopolysaccharide-assembly [Candidatus Kryptonium thompsonii]|uniref:Lipopolysaccharide-assembly n=1 Tax=Candidatus Kryptonium thompsonii TaxID=1633631 RepID=A0A0P1MCY3_9BACT|nr:LptE family protein [Candidatus Kryptonium thompsoni]CUS82763.1 Lipopolysaccharide-assembly [Candidatus Kryptonium thompsoni]CUS84333.1 Lipopolysaccharide-assembly [Candidatus Kryptonium thompsoni]CUS85484.1 Lipopolysaccharide-assembly [Candidatus Kryptonium thompsoni]CUS91922.1 Lipopolysaccharide-assembly [Candidatus Kryptonium thompsoni]CUS92935.1 Lipopolysaccharide-assembly [Candidatus Kryptonium thompsoni]